MLKNCFLVLPIKTAYISLPESSSISLLENDLQPLKNNILENGIISPLIIREKTKARYEVVCGKRRLACAKILGLKTVPCIKISADEKKAEILSLCEAVSVKEPDFFTLAARLADLTVNGENETDVLRYRLGLSEAFMREKLDINKLSSDIKRRITSAGLNEKQTKELLRVSPENRTAALDYIIANSLCERETAAYIDSLLTPKKEPEKPMRKAAISDLKLFSNSLSKLLSTLSFAGYNTTLQKSEAENYSDYKIRIYKKSDSEEYLQLPLC